ncbi:MAG: hypothetical protein IJ827_01195 [Lachnospiraceae bacterium]|nr:hypothetical protein [Lachnospiraceae bacterium]MBR1913423.1 hypothetical protein [Lachnospiraceae bacterium]
MGRKKAPVPKAVLTVRLLVGAYLLYIDYDIFFDVLARKGASRIIMFIAMALFAVVGVFLIVGSARSLIVGDAEAADSALPDDSLSDDTPPDSKDE